MIRRLQLVAAVALQEAADPIFRALYWLGDYSDRLAKRALGDESSAQCGEVHYWDGEMDWINVRDVGITQALRETEEP